MAFESLAGRLDVGELLPGGNSKILARQLHEVGIGHDAILNARLPARCHQVISDIYFAGPECLQSISNTQSKRVRVKFMKFNSCFPERFAGICRIQLEIRQHLVRVRVFLQFRLCDRFEKCHNSWAAHNDNRLLFCRGCCDRAGTSAQSNTGDCAHQAFHTAKVL